MASEKHALRSGTDLIRTPANDASTAETADASARYAFGKCRRCSRISVTAAISLRPGLEGSVNINIELWISATKLATMNDSLWVSYRIPVAGQHVRHLM
jgi:hypothetical protein